MTPTDYARRLLSSLGCNPALAPVDDRPAGELWAGSGAQWLTGHPEQPPRFCPAPLAACAQGAWLALAALAPDRFDPTFDASRLLGERAAIAGLGRGGRRSAGGACRLLPTRDGFLALNVARPDDIELFPAWLEEAADTRSMPAIVATQPSRWLLERARLLGLAAAPLRPPRPRPFWFRARQLGASQLPRRHPPLVVDLGTLWAGPLCGQLLRQSGARVIKVESTSRPDGAREGPPPFFDLLNAGKESVALDLRQSAGQAQLRALLARADIVIETSRPRALEQLGVDAGMLVASRPGKVWLGISGYGRRALVRNWVAYGDDAGVAGGLSWLLGGDRGDPVFCADAVADPLAGLHGALLALAIWQRGGGMLLDLSLVGVASHAIQAGRALPAPGTTPLPPVARPVSARAAVLGADTDRVLGELL